MANTFAIIVSGRLVRKSVLLYFSFSQVPLSLHLFQVQTDFQLVESNKFLITIPNADNINHLVVFMTGLCPLPEGMAGAGRYFVLIFKSTLE